jgi:hypothetical protein
LPESLKSIVRDCMVTDKNRRVSSFDTVADRLQAALPEVERWSARLPSAAGDGPPSDPDATNALPVMRPSDRPPPAAESASMLVTSPGGPSSGPRSGNSPPGAFSAPWATAQGATTMSTRGPGLGILLGAGGGVAVLGLIAIALVLASRGSGDAKTTPTSSAMPAVANVGSLVDAAAAVATPTSTEPPVVSIDQLPVASGKAAASGAPKATGHLSVAASPGWCAISVDGVKQGDTPIAGLSLSAGMHRVDCSPPKGKLRSVTLSIQDGATSKYKFSLDEP